MPQNTQNDTNKTAELTTIEKLADSKNVKKTMVNTFETIENLLKDKKISQDAYNSIFNTITKNAKSKRSGGTKEVINTLYSKDGKILAKHCNATDKWFKIDRFAAKSGRVKEIDSIMKKEYSKVSKVRKEAEEVFKSISSEKDGAKKLVLLGKYEELMNKAEPKLPTANELNSVEGGFKTIEEIAKNLSVEVISTNPKS